MSLPLKTPANPPRVAVIREEGSNGDREMSAAFIAAGFEAWDVKMSDLVQGSPNSSAYGCQLTTLLGKVTLDAFRGAAFVGGFSFADVLGSAKGWAAAIRYNTTVLAQFDAFKQRADSFSLGVCNGCQLMGLLGWIDLPEQKVVLSHNTSSRYESRWTTVKIAAETPAILLKGMENAQLGVWISHGEGKFSFEKEAPKALSPCVPLAYVDDEGQPTEVYPLNANGSPGGIAAMCSADGRHLAMMPHPERCFLQWQTPWLSPEVAAALPTEGLLSSPWLRLFTNAYDWCTQK